jgi:AbrB family looped-hinge helix DNA binding protein
MHCLDGIDNYGYPYSKEVYNMRILTSRLTSKGQITIPKQVRDSLNVADGDSLVFEVRENEAVIRKLPSIDPEWAKALRPTLSEWEDNLDDKL